MVLSFSRAVIYPDRLLGFGLEEGQGQNEEGKVRRVRTNPLRMIDSSAEMSSWLLATFSMLRSALSMSIPIKLSLDSGFH